MVFYSTLNEAFCVSTMHVILYSAAQVHVSGIVLYLYVSPKHQITWNRHWTLHCLIVSLRTVST